MANPWYRNRPRRQRCSRPYCCNVARTSHPLFICEECKKHKPNTASCLDHVYDRLFVCKHFNNRIVYKDFTNFRLPNIFVGPYVYPKEYFNYYPTIELSRWAYLQPIHKNYAFYTRMYARQGQPIGYIYKDVGSYGGFQEYELYYKYLADVFGYFQGKIFYARKAGGSYLNLLSQELFVIIRLYLSN